MSRSGSLRLFYLHIIVILLYFTIIKTIYLCSNFNDFLRKAVLREEDNKATEATEAESEKKIIITKNASIQVSRSSSKEKPPKSKSA